MSVEKVQVAPQFAPPPSSDATLDDLLLWSTDTTRQIFDVLAELTEKFNNVADGRVGFLKLDVLTVEPEEKPDGLIIYADGTIFNPGSGEGIYGRENGAWVKL